MIKDHGEEVSQTADQRKSLLLCTVESLVVVSDSSLFT